MKDEMMINISDFYKILSDYSRLKIVIALLDKEKCVGDIEKEVGMSQTAVSYQLKTLKNGHLVKYRREGKNIIYSIDDEHVRDIIKITIEHINEGYEC